MFNVIHAPLPKVTEKTLKQDAALELRELKLNQRLLDSYYAQLRAENVKEVRKLRSKGI